MFALSDSGDMYALSTSPAKSDHVSTQVQCGVPTHASQASHRPNPNPWGGKVGRSEATLPHLPTSPTDLVSIPRLRATLCDFR